MINNHNNWLFDNKTVKTRYEKKIRFIIDRKNSQTLSNSQKKINLEVAVLLLICKLVFLVLIILFVVFVLKYYEIRGETFTFLQQILYYISFWNYESLNCNFKLGKKLKYWHIKKNFINRLLGSVIRLITVTDSLIGHDERVLFISVKSVNITKLVLLRWRRYLMLPNFQNRRCCAM